MRTITIDPDACLPHADPFKGMECDAVWDPRTKDTKRAEVEFERVGVSNAEGVDDG